MNYNVPFNVSLRDYEGMLNNRQYWDDLGAEWGWSTMSKSWSGWLAMSNWVVTSRK